MFERFTAGVPQPDRTTRWSFRAGGARHAAIVRAGELERIDWDLK